MSFLKKLKDKMKATTEDVAKKGAEAEDKMELERKEMNQARKNVMCLTI